MGQGILEFLEFVIAEFRHCWNSVIAREQSDRSNLTGAPSLRGSKATEAISSKHRHCEALKKEGAISLGHRHCEALKKAEAISFKKFRYSHLLSLEILNEIASSFVSLTPRNDGIPEFLKHRHCEGAKRPKQSHQIAVIASEAKQSHWGTVIARL